MEIGRLSFCNLKALLVCFCCLLFINCATVRETPLQRPQILNATVYTAYGTPLRGTAIFTAGNEPGEFLMTGDEMQQLTENGLNALHIYAERRADGKPVGFSAQNCDYLIAEAEKNNIVVVLTISEFNLEADNIDQEIQFIYDFWEFYAERYKDKKNVIFEICNEMPTIAESVEVEAKAYEIIRRHAPDAMVLFYSFASTEYLDTVISYVEKLEAQIGDDNLWSNAALAFHGYECQEDLKGADGLRQVIHTLTRKGYPLINTELPNRFELSDYPDTALLRVCEEEGVSWLSFVSWERITVPSIWRGQLEAAGIAWEPDTGDWPIIDAVFPFKEQLAWEIAESTPVEYISEYRFIAYKLSSQDFLELKRLNFGTRAPSMFSIEGKVEGSGVVSLYLNTDGVLLGQKRISDTEGKYRDILIPFDTSVVGVKDITMSFESEEDGHFYVKSWECLLPEQKTYSNPYGSVVFAADYPFHTGDIKRAVSTDPISTASRQVEGIVNDSSLTFDFVEFHGESVEFHIRAKPLSGGTITIIAGDHRFQVYELGEIEITGERGVWREYTCILRQEEILMFDPVKQFLDLSLVFTGVGKDELFVLSEFWFEEL